MRENEYSISEPKSTNYADQISSFLVSDNPLEKLNKISEGIKDFNYFLEYKNAVQLKNDLENPTKKKSATLELIYKCLPTLNCILQNAKGLGGEDQELFNIGFESLVESINIWQSKEDISKRDCNLKFIAHQNTEEKVKKYIVSNFNLSLRHFILVKQYFHAINEFKNTCNRTPRSEDWNNLNEIINENIEKLSKKERKEIEKLRFFKSKKIEHAPYRLIDIFQLIHNRIYPSSKKIPSPSEDSFPEKVLDLISHMSEHKILSNCFTAIDPRQQEILEMHYGLNSQKPTTFKKIAEKLDLSPGRIEQIEIKALEKIRKHRKNNV